MITPQLIIQATKGNITQVVFGPAIPSIVGLKMAELKRSGNWNGWTLKMRNFAPKPLLTYEQKKLK